MVYVKDCLKNMDYVEGTDYGQVLKIRKKHMNRNIGGSSTNGINWFGTNK